MISSVLLVLLAFAGVVAADFPAARPDPASRTYTSSAINSLIDNLTPLFIDPELAVLFSNCLPNTLDTTVKYYGAAQNWEGTDSFVITGDINALWLRDSGNQVIPYIPYISEDQALKDLFQGLINRHAHSVLIDSFANAFNFNASGAGSQRDIRYPPMTKSVFEGKYEIDSLCAFLKISFWYNYYGNLSEDEVNTVYNADWFAAVAKLLDTVQVMIVTNGQSESQPYHFQRVTSVATDTLMLSGLGTPAGINGLTRSLFRPSDDAVTLPYNIPGNAMACTELTHTLELLTTLGSTYPSIQKRIMLNRYGSQNEDLLSYMAQIRATICTALESVVGQNVIPYEVDGFGSQYYMDDANIPSLLSLPVLGYMSNRHQAYQNTRNYVLSSRNPFYFSGPQGHGIGGPHVGYNFTWPMSIVTAAMTSEDETEIKDCLAMLKASAARTGFMHESFNVNDVNNYTRSWFAWANGLFGELVLQLIMTKPHLIIKDDTATITLAQSYVKPPVSLQSIRNTLIK